LNKQTTKSDAAEDAAGADLPQKRKPAAIDPGRVKNLAQVLGDPVQLVIEDDRDPLEVLGDMTYWQALPAKHFPVGSRFELTNDAGTFLADVWVRAVFGSASSGVRDIRFHHRFVWDDREDAVVNPFVPTGRWEVRYDGRHFLWRVYRPNGVVVGVSFKDQTSAEVYRRQNETSPRAR
jgi:hypothetical protein